MRKIDNPLSKKGKATDLSLIVADKLHALRKAQGKSQREFAECMGISFQQYQKYEKGRDRISFEKLYMLCREIGISLGLFDNLAATGFAESEQAAYGQAPNDEQELLAIFRGLTPKSRKNFLESARQTGKMSADKNA